MTTSIRPPALLVGQEFEDYQEAFSYEVTRDFDEPPSGGDDIPYATSLHVTHPSAQYGALALPFAAEVWFCKTRDGDGGAIGDLLLAADPSAPPEVAEMLGQAGLPPTTFMVVANVMPAPDIWKTVHKAYLDELVSAGAVLNKTTNVWTPLRQFSVDYVVDQLFMRGQAKIRVAGEGTDAYLPLRLFASADETAISIFCGYVRNTPSSESISPEMLMAWALKQKRRLFEHERVVPVSLGYLYSIVDKSFYGSQYWADHASLQAVTECGVGFYVSTYSSIWAFLGGGAERWRKIVLTTDSTPREEATPWTGWTDYEMQVGKRARKLLPVGEEYWKLPDGVHLVSLKSDTHSALPLRRPFTPDTASSPMALDVNSDKHALLAELKPLSFSVETGAVVYSNQVDPTELDGNGGANNGKHFAVYATKDSKKLYRMCSGRDNTRADNRNPGNDCVHNKESPKFGLDAGGYFSLTNYMERNSSALLSQGVRNQDQKWDNSQLRALAAVSVNEAQFEGVNTWDPAYLSFGIIQWIVFTPPKYPPVHPGELAGFVQFFKLKYPDEYWEYFGRSGLDATGVAADTGDNIPRGYLKLPDGTVLNDAATSAQLGQIRRYEWSLRFQIAGLSKAVQDAEALYAYERLKVLRDRKLTLSDGKDYAFSSLFTSERLVALIVDQHVNSPGTVERALKAAVPSTATGKDLPLDSSKLIDAYKEQRAQQNASGKFVMMTDPIGRAQRIEKFVPALSASPGTFAWPSGKANEWLSGG